MAWYIFNEESIMLTGETNIKLNKILCETDITFVATERRVQNYRRLRKNKTLIRIIDLTRSGIYNMENIMNIVDMKIRKKKHCVEMEGT